MDLASQLRALADRLPQLEPAQVVGELEAIKFQLWTVAPPPSAPAPEDTLLDAVAVAALLAVPEKQARKLMATRAIPVIRVGARYVRVRPADLRAYVATQRAGVVGQVAPGYSIPHDKHAAPTPATAHPADDPTRAGRHPRRSGRHRVALGNRLESDPPTRRHRHHAPGREGSGGAPLDVGAADAEP
jgi:hypothetical protein